MAMKNESKTNSLNIRLRAITILICLSLLATAVIGCEGKKTRADTLASPANVKPSDRYSDLSDTFRKALWEFAFKTSGSALTVHDDANALYSPISLYYALAMVEAGAGGETKSELRAFLAMLDEMDAGAELQKLYALMLHEGTSEELIANAVWMRSELGDQVGQDWLDQLANRFYASAFKVDFKDKATAEKMSKWVEKQTRGKIKPKIDLSDADMILMNTLYFKAEWEKAFEKADSLSDVFFAPSGTLADVLFMNAVCFSQEYLVAEEFRASAIKLKNGKIDFILPNEGISPETLLANPEFLKSVCEGKRETADIAFSIPQFSYRSKIDVFEKMETLGLREMLQNNPDLSVMLPAVEAIVSNITQEAFIDLNEEGVEAAAYTQIDIKCTAVLPPDDLVEMKFNRPFIYVISDDAGVPLFVGVVNNPLAN
ncbi:MAG TPA: serpin family protein [Clostridiaceae bacterium]|nr:serpin family protein [Clostridiaceae bacterium]